MDSLLEMEIYGVCYPAADGAQGLNSPFIEARKKFYTTDKETVRVKIKGNLRGYPGKISGKLTRRSIYWKARANGAVLEESFDRAGESIIVNRDFQGNILSRAFFGKDQRWERSEYYSPGQSARAEVIFKPGKNSISRLNWSEEKQCYLVSSLLPSPYLGADERESEMEENFGEPEFLVSASNGEFCFSKERVQRERIAFLDAPAEEEKAEDFSEPEPEEPEDNIEFPGISDYARVIPADEGEEQSGAHTPGEQGDTPPPESCDQTEDESLADEKDTEKGAGEIPDFSLPKPVKYVENGVYRDIPPEDGFGEQFFPGGSLRYAGFWKDGKRQGLGASFKEGEHLLHVTGWQDGKPGIVVSLFDRDGNLRYGGKIISGKKEGAGVSIRQADGSVFVGKWKDGKPTGWGAFIDKDGDLLYYGSWKDGRRDGRGTEFDKDGQIVFEGEFREDKYFNGAVYREVLPFADEEDPLFDFPNFE